MCVGVPGGVSAEPGGIGAGVSGGWFEGDLVAEGFELADVAAFALFRVDAGGEQSLPRSL